MRKKKSNERKEALLWILWQQKKYSFTKNGHTYYCYLDIYLEAPDGSIKVFEVKATSNAKFYRLGKAISENKEKDVPISQKFECIFYKDGDGIFRLKEILDPTLLEDKTYLLPNLSVSIIPIFYATIFNLFLLLVETRVNKAAE